jgi:hypothetical protein
MMLQFISVKITNESRKSLIQPLYQFLIKPFHGLAAYRYLMVGLLLFSSTGLLAETVQRWQDAQGQWHFGDQAAAKGHSSKPVLIKTPISIVKNDQAVNTSVAFADTRPKKTARKPSKAMAVSKQKTSCEALQQQLYDRTAKSKKPQRYQSLVARYERECIAGQYYGN